MKQISVNYFIKQSIGNRLSLLNEYLRTTVSSIHSNDSSAAEQLHLSLVLTLAESLAAIGKIDEALEEAKQAGTNSFRIPHE